jgi:O-methyltransferase
MNTRDSKYSTVQRMKALVKRNLPTPIVRVVSKLIYHRDPLLQADIDADYREKGNFFRQAFKALEFNGISGDYVEFGCSGGMTFRLAFDQIAARKAKRHLWAFDSFQGLPENASPMDSHPGWKRGAYATTLEEFREICEFHPIPQSSYTMVPGFYTETLGKAPQDYDPTDIALAYIDCDLYSSAKTVLEFLKPRLKHGMILAFDDYFCWSAELLSGEKKAFLDVLSGNTKWKFSQYRDFSWGGHSIVVESANLYTGLCSAG